MSVLLPILTGVWGIIPKFFYNVAGEKRTQMYNELYERRKLTRDEINARAEEDFNAER